MGFVLNVTVNIEINFFLFVFNRLNDMWTISLQDREQACWEEVSIFAFLIIILSKLY